MSRITTDTDNEMIKMCGELDYAHLQISVIL
jgi:hypothetical protein